METNIPGVYAAGDIRQGARRQIVTAASDGAVAAMSAIDYLEQEQRGG
jgi:thioredoxin reductase (NADPH)